MPIPLLAIAAGISAAQGLKGLFSGDKHPYGKYIRPPFNFNMPDNDPELEWMRHQILLGGQESHRNTLDDISRAGLLGSSAGFAQLDKSNLDTTRSLEGAAGSIYGARRAEAHGDYAGDVGYARQLESGAIERGAAERSSGLGAIGHLGGSFLQDYWRKKFLMGGSGGEPGGYQYFDNNQPWLGGYS